MYQKKFNVEKKTKVKIINDFIINKEILNAKAFKKKKQRLINFTLLRHE